MKMTSPLMVTPTTASRRLGAPPSSLHLAVHVDALAEQHLPGPENAVFWLLSGLRAHAKIPYKTDLL
jgi:hypothetical protein